MTNHTTTAPVPLASALWLKSRRFDLPYLFAIPAFAILVGSYVAANPDTFSNILFVNLWLLGYHHVISTYTRIAFSFQSVREHRFLVFALPVIVLLTVLLVAQILGAWVIATTYLYWQCFHYVRQSYGIARAYKAKSGAITPPWQDVNTYAIYLLPLTGILYRSYQAPEAFLFLDLKTLPVSWEVVVAFGAMTVAAILMQMAQWVKQYRQGTLQWPYMAYVLTHYAIFTTGYLLIENINYGWLVLNIWHNAQYIGFVWMYNNRRYQNGVEENHKFISTISQNGNAAIYLMICLLVTMVFYSAVRVVDVAVQLHTALPATVILYMVINFHHYIVDSMIWKRKRMITKPQ